MPSGMVGRSYLESGKPVTVLARWAQPDSVVASGVIWHRPPKRNAPRNVLIERGDGSRTVRPFRGLRRIEGENDGSD